MWKVWLAAVCCSCSALAGPLEDLHAKDRGVQRAAVEAMVGSGDVWVKDLVAVAKESDRFDVRAHALEALGRSGPDGTDALVALAVEDIGFARQDGHRELLVRALASVGPGVLDRLEERVLAGSGSVYILREIAVRMGTDMPALARRMLTSPSSHARIEGARHLLLDLPSVERERALVELWSDEHEAVRTAVAFPEGLGLWDRAAFDALPEAAEAIVAKLVALLGSDSPEIVRAAAKMLELSGVQDAGVGAALLHAGQRDGLSIRQRASVLRAGVVVHPDHPATVAAVAAMLTEHPHAACAALDAAPVDAIPDSVMTGVVAALDRTDVREWNAAQEFLVPRDPSRRAALLPRIIEPLADAVRVGDDRQAKLAASILGMLGSDARDATAALIERLRRMGSDRRAEPLAAALVSVGIDEPDVREALTTLVQRSAGTPPDHYAAGATLRRLSDEHGDRDWVRALVEPAFRDPGHPLHSYVVWYPPASAEPVIEDNVTRLLADLAVTRARDAAWAYATAEGAEPADPSALTHERDRRTNAAMALLRLRKPDASVIEALASVVASPVLRSPRPEPVDWSVQPRTEAMRRAGRAAVVWDSELSVVGAAAGALAVHVDGDEVAMKHALTRIGDHSLALALLVSAPIWDEHGAMSRMLDVPEGTAEKFLPSMLEWARHSTPFESRQSQLISALGNLRVVSAEREAVLREIVMFGAGKDGPPAALVSLGHVRPVGEGTAALIREHLHDPRGSVRSAAISAAGALGSDGFVLLDELFAIAERFPGTSVHSGVVAAVRLIAPDDARLAVLERAWEAARPTRP